jgi:hypothetical protein
MKKHFKFCVIDSRNNEVYASDNYIDFKPAFESLLIDVDININDNGVMTIEGHEKEYSISFEKTNINDLDKPVESKYIKHYPGFKLFGIQFTKPYDYVQGWYAYEQKHPKTIIMNKFMFEII